MKRLALLRHAKSSWDDAARDDLHRPLNERGWRAARRIGRELRERAVKFDLVLSSTATRTRETIDGVQENYDFASAIEFDPRLYGASEAALLEIVRRLDESVKAPLIVGHNPGLEQLVAGLTKDDSKGLRQRVTSKFPTATLAILELPATRWAEVERASGEVVELILPRELD